jgi:hypothetical protein
MDILDHPHWSCSHFWSRVFWSRYSGKEKICWYCQELNYGTGNNIRSWSCFWLCILNFYCYRESFITSGTAIHCFTCFTICEISLLPRMCPLTKSCNFKKRLKNLERNLQIFFSDLSMLTFESVAVTVRICTPSIKIKKFYILPTEHLYLLYLSQKKHRRFLYTTLNERFL